MFDLIIRQATVVDGTRRPRFTSDVAIQGDRIAAIDQLESANATLVIDAKGLVLAPGFVDVHNHSDGWMMKFPHLTAKTTQGFTTEVLMSDGISYAPVNQHTFADWIFYLRSLNGLRLSDYDGWTDIRSYLSRLDRRNVQNSIAQIPYANVRSLYCGFGPDVVDDFQMLQIQATIRQEMENGAVGLSTGLDYLVQCFSTTDELVDACRAMHSSRGLYVTHMRYKKGLMAGLREAVEIGRRADVPVHISHLKAISPYSADEVLEYIDRTARHEVDFSFDVYPYQPGSTMLGFLLPYEVWRDGPLAALGKLTDRKVRERFRAGLENYRLDYDQMRIAWVGSRDNAHLHGRSLADVISSSGKSPEDALCDLLIEERLAVLCVFHEGDDRLVWPFLSHDLYMMGSDGIYFPEGTVHPRVFGSATRLLGPGVRDWNLFSLEDAVYKLAAYPAKRFGLKDRGEIRVGAFADLVVFDPLTVRDKATFVEPRQESIGIRDVFVNGVRVVEDGQPRLNFSGSYPGRSLRRNVAEF